MRRQLIIVGLIAALSAGGAVGALASALCAHDGADASEHACCRAETGGDSATESCPMSAHKKADADAAHGAHGESQTTHAAKESHAAHKAKVAAAWGGARLVAPSGCAHCVGDAGTPPAAFKLRGADSARRGAGDVAPRSTPRAGHPFDSFLPQVTPTQGAPPGETARRHVLHSVFLI